MQAVLNHGLLAGFYPLRMARETKTSRTKKRYREKDADHPISRYCAAAIRKAGGNAAKLADDMGLTRAALSQWISGEAHPSIENIVDLSIKSGLSLGYLSALSAEYQNKPAPKVGEIEGRYALLPEMLQPTVLAALDSAEELERHLPKAALGHAVKNTRLSPNWAAPVEDKKPKK